MFSQLVLLVLYLALRLVGVLYVLCLLRLLPVVLCKQSAVGIATVRSSITAGVSREGIFCVFGSVLTCEAE